MLKDSKALTLKTKQTRTPRILSSAQFCQFCAVSWDTNSSLNILELYERRAAIEIVFYTFLTQIL